MFSLFSRKRERSSVLSRSFVALGLFFFARFDRREQVSWRRLVELMMLTMMMIENRPRVTQLFACFLSAETKEEFFFLFKFEQRRFNSSKWFFHPSLMQFTDAQFIFSLSFALLSLLTRNTQTKPTKVPNPRGERRGRRRRQRKIRQQQSRMGSSHER